MVMESQETVMEKSWNLFYGKVCGKPEHDAMSALLSIIPTSQGECYKCPDSVHGD